MTRRSLALLVVTLVLLAAGLHQWRAAEATRRNCSDAALMPGDAYTMRAARKFVEHGFLVHGGLPDLYYEGPWTTRLFETWRAAGSPVDFFLRAVPDDIVYTHGLRLDAWLVALVMHLDLGEDPWDLRPYRVTSLALGLGGLALLAAALLRALGPGRGALAFVLFMAVPAPWRNLHGIDTARVVGLGLVVQAAALVAWQLGGRRDRPRQGVAAGATLVATGVVGAIDFIPTFVVLGMPLALGLLARAREGAAATARTAKALAWSLVGLAAGHLLHFALVVRHHRSLERATYDLLASAGTYATPRTPLPELLRTYSLHVFGRGDYLGPVFGLCLLLALARVASQAAQGAPGWGERLGALVVALAASGAWVVAMPWHSRGHPFLVADMFQLSQLVVALVLASPPPPVPRPPAP